jgi:hypothetical protein
MLDLIKGAWNGLPQTGRTIVLVALIAVVAVLLGLTMYWNYDWSGFAKVWAELS